MACCPMLCHNLPILFVTKHLVRCCFKSCPPYRQHRSLVRNPYLTTAFSTLVGNSQLTAKFPTLVGNSHLSTVFPTLVRNSHLTATFSILVRNSQLSTDFYTLTDIYASTPKSACYLQRGSLPDVVPKFTHLIKKMPAHRISCLNSAVLFTRQRLVRCRSNLCPAYRQHCIFPGHRNAPGRSAPPGAALYFHFLLL